MKARLLRKWGGQYAGQIMSNVEKGDFPAGVAEYFEDDDPAIITVRPPSPHGGGADDPHMVNDDVVLPLKGSDYEKSQQADVKAVQAAHDEQEEAQQEVLTTNVEKGAKGATAAKGSTKGSAKTKSAAKGKK